MPEKCQSPKAVAEANVTITIKGLAICNYNQNNRNWEAVFPRHVKHHNLKIIVNKCRSGILENSQTYDIDAKEKIYVVSGTAGAESNYYSDSLNRVIDFSAPNLYNGKVDFFRDKSLSLSFLSISGGVYYTKQLSRKTYRILKGGQQVDVKQIGLGIGADITCGAGGKTEIIVANHPNLIPVLFPEDSVVYEIIFDNDCYEPVTEGECDFDRYYDLIDMPDQITLDPDETPRAPELPPVEPLEDPPKNPPCNAVIVSELGSGLTSLSGLL